MGPISQAQLGKHPADDQPGSKLQIGPWEGLGVLGLWSAAAVLAGWLVFRFRDA